MNSQKYPNAGQIVRVKVQWRKIFSTGLNPSYKVDKVDFWDGKLTAENHGTLGITLVHPEKYPFLEPTEHYSLFGWQEYFYICQNSEHNTKWRLKNLDTGKVSIISDDEFSMLWAARFMGVFYGCQYWIENGEFHRENGPSCIYADGTKEYHNHGKLHRLNGPALTHANGDCWWYKEDKIHRVGGPAISFADGGRFWYQENRLHNENGPAAIFPNGDKVWYLHGEKITPPSKTKEFLSPSMLKHTNADKK